MCTVDIFITSSLKKINRFKKSCNKGVKIKVGQFRFECVSMAILCTFGHKDEWNTPFFELPFCCNGDRMFFTSHRDKVAKKTWSHGITKVNEFKHSRG